MADPVTEFLKPRIVNVETINERRAKVSLEPLEKGFGHTLGNALRRILLSSMPGCAIVDAEIENDLLALMQKDPKARNAKCIGEITSEHPGKVVMKSGIGGKRIVTPLIGEQLPRIC